MYKTTVTITELIEKAGHTIRELGYAGFTVQAHLDTWRALENYAHQGGLIYYTTELFLAYAEEKFQSITLPSSTKYKSSQFNHLVKLDEFYKFGTITPARRNKKIYCFEGCFKESVRAFLQLKSRFLSKARVQSYELYLERFCSYMSYGFALEALDELTGSQVMAFMEDCKVYTKSTVYATTSCLRQYLDYLYAEGFSTSKLSSVLPKVDRRRQKEIPSVYSSDEIERLLLCFDLENPKENRDYTMVLTAVRLGLRASDIVSLRFSEIDWERNTISLIQKKTRQPATYPLLKEIGEAIISYIKTARPQSDNEYIFLRSLAPYTRLNNGSMYNITEKYFTRAGISGNPDRSRGPHALRHSLSSMLLENDVPLPIISEILAHKSSDTTKAYLKIAERQLAHCALPVPIIEMGADCHV